MSATDPTDASIGEQLTQRLDHLLAELEIDQAEFSATNTAIPSPDLSVGQAALARVIEMAQDLRQHIRPDQ